jgi:putative oxidoreductase
VLECRADPFAALGSGHESIPLHLGGILRTTDPGSTDMTDRTLPTSIGLLVLRAGIGGFMLSHGIGKLKMLLEGADFVDPIGLGTWPSLLLVTLAEFGGALLVVLGLLTRFGAASIVCAMAVAAFVVHAADPWSMETAAQAFLAGQSKSFAAKEGALLYLIPALALVFTGPGRLSVDQWLVARRRARKGGR